MARLKLKNPAVPNPVAPGVEWEIVTVAVSVPVPHLEGLYSYRAEKGAASLGSVVKIPFGQGETFGFVVRIEEDDGSDTSLKRILSVLHPEPLYETPHLMRYQRIAELYGSSLFSVISAANPSWRSRSDGADERTSSSILKPSRSDLDYLERLFGQKWRSSKRMTLVVPPGVLWDRVTVSLLLADPRSTLVLVPTERQLRFLDESLRQRGIKDHVTISSVLKKSERASAYCHLREQSASLVIGTRSSALAPINPERVIIIDPGDENHRERRSPYFRVDDSSMWSDTGQVLKISYLRTLASMREKQTLALGRGGCKASFEVTSTDRIVRDISKATRLTPNGAWVLVSLNDKSFASGLICSSCRNRGICDCGFSLTVPKRGAPPSCEKCLREFTLYLCRHCGGSKLTAVRGGGEALGLSIGKSIKGARIIISNSNALKDEVIASARHTVVVATQGSEPRIRSEDGKRYGYDAVIMIGGRAAFSSPSIARVDRFRLAWGRLLGLSHPKEALFLVDVEANHPEYQELKQPGNPRGLDIVMRERSELGLPPFSGLVALKGEDRVLQRLRISLESDQLFRNPQNVIFPVHDGRMILKIDSEQRLELLRLLQEMTRIRSAKRLPRIDYDFDPEDM